jgi:hypothetical protein
MGKNAELPEAIISGNGKKETGGDAGLAWGLAPQRRVGDGELFVDVYRREETLP